jgi:uncharacterized membrane protein
MPDAPGVPLTQPPRPVVSGPVNEASEQTITPEEIASGRLLAAVAYLPGLCFIGLLGVPENRYVGFHARQGFILLLLEIVVGIAFLIFDASLGQIPYVGIVLGGILKFMVWMALLVITVYGVAKGASGEVARMPFVAEAADKVPF